MKTFIALCLIMVTIVSAACQRIYVTEKTVAVVAARPTPPGPGFVRIGSGYIKKAESKHIVRAIGLNHQTDGIIG